MRSSWDEASPSVCIEVVSTIQMGRSKKFALSQSICYTFYVSRLIFTKTQINADITRINTDNYQRKSAQSQRISANGNFQTICFQV